MNGIRPTMKSLITWELLTRVPNGGRRRWTLITKRCAYLPTVRRLPCVLVNYRLAKGRCREQKTLWLRGCDPPPTISALPRDSKRYRENWEPRMRGPLQGSKSYAIHSQIF